jgi:hypothetical protein
MGNQHLMIDTYSPDYLAEQTKLLAESAANHCSDVETSSANDTDNEYDDFNRNLDSENKAFLRDKGFNVGIELGIDEDELKYMDDDDDMKKWLDGMDQEEAGDGNGDESDASMDLSE